MVNPLRVSYRSSQLTDVLALTSTSGAGSGSAQRADIDGHMKRWTDMGWRLVTVTSVTRDGHLTQEITHTFFWEHS